MDRLRSGIVSKLAHADSLNMKNNTDNYTYHPDEIKNAKRERRPVLLSRLFRYDHLTHQIPLGSLVEVDVKINEGFADAEINLTGTCKIYVVGHMRDCDGTPLYILSDLPVHYPRHNFSREWFTYKAISHVYLTGYSEESLKPTGKAVTLSKSIAEHFAL